MQGKTILFQGDSITDGNRYKDESSRWDLNHQIGHAYPYVIAAQLGSQFPERHYSFINRGVSGNRIAQLYGRWKEDTLLYKPDILSVLIGVNDCGATREEGTGSDPVRYEKIYRLLLDETLSCNTAVKFVLMEPFMLPVGPVAGEWEKKRAQIAPLQSAVARVAADYDAVFVPLQQKFIDLTAVREPSYWIWDGVHPTEAGHGILAAEWMRLAQGIL